jgi:hypothetical protein
LQEENKDLLAKFE